MKERKQSKILGLMLAFCMVLTMTISGLGALPISAAEGDDTVSFYIGGVQLASYNTPVSEGVVAYYQNDGTVSTTEPTSWNAKLEYNATTGYTLTLNGLQASPSMASSGINDRSCIYMGDTQLPLNIVLNGTNTLTAENDFGRGIYTALSSVNVSGTGSLTMVGNMYGIQATELSVLGGEVEFSSINASCPDTMTVSSFAGSSVKVGNNAETATAWDGTTHWSNYKYVSIVPLSHAHPICGSSHTDIGNHTGACENKTWTAVSTEADLKAMTAGGSYYLANDIELTSGLTVPSINICLNGFELKQSANAAAIIANGGVTLNICDCSDEHTGTIIGGDNNNGSGIFCSGYSAPTVLNVYGCKFTGCTGGAAIGLEYDATANLYGCTITGNNGSYGGVYSWFGPTLNIYGGTITNNTADYAGGGIWLYKSTMNISGDVKISENTLNGEENNVHIEVSSSDPAVLNVGALSSNSEIGITLGETGYREVTPGNYEQYVEFMEGTFSATGASYIDNFFSDVDGYKIVADGQGLKLVKIVEAKWGASKDSLTESGTLADALSEAQDSNTDIYIQLQSDAELSRPYSFENGEDVMITLDLNGYDITATLDGYTRLFGIGYVGSGGSTYGNLTLTDTSSGDKGSITVNTGTVYMCDGSTCHIGGGISIVSTSGYALRFEGGTATAEEGGFSVTSEDSSAIYMNGATLNGNNIPFTAITNSDNYSTAAIYVDQGDVTGLNATVTGPTALSLGHSWYPSKFFNVEITGGTYRGTQYYAIAINNESGENSSLSLKGGTFIADTEADGVINLYDGGSVLNTYGALLAENYVYTNEAGSMAIKNETKLAEARTLVVKSIDDVPAGKLIISIEKISTEGLVDTYRITYDDGTTYDFTVTNGADGSDGSNGSNGQNGTNGITPTFKIENGELKVSYDNGTNWTSLGNIQGANGSDGADGSNGQDGKTPSFKVENGNLYVRYSDTEEWTLLGNIQGADGTDGADGSDGQDGKTPTFKVENDVLYVSYLFSEGTGNQIFGSVELCLGGFAVDSF